MDISLTLVLLAVVVLGLAFLLWQRRRPAGLPPGPAHVPYLGSILSVTEKDLVKQLDVWRDMYGDMFTYSMGNQHVVVLNDFESIKEAFVTHATEFAGRLPPANRDELTNPHHPVQGIIFSTHTDEWRRQRNTSLQILRSLGYGKKTIDSKVQEECQYLKEVFVKSGGEPVDPVQAINTSVSNIICSLLFGERYDHGDAEFTGLINSMHAYLSAYLKERLAEYVGFLRLRPAYKKHVQMMKSHTGKLSDFYDQKIAERSERMNDTASKPGDFIEHYLVKLREARTARAGYIEITEDWLNRIVNDFFVAGTETTSTTLSWGLLWMALNPDKQRLLQEELDRYSRGAALCEFKYSERHMLPYLEATVFEILRISSITSYSLVHTTTETIQFRGYTLPEGTAVLANLRGVLKDPELWSEPNKFIPERFIDEQGKTTKPEYWIPFSMGRRSCMGEQLARKEIFTFIAVLLHNFSISLPEDAPSPDLAGVQRFTIHPPAYNIHMKPRL